jgi:hypothetical protein
MKQNENFSGETKNYFSREQNDTQKIFLAEIFSCPINTSYKNLEKNPQVIYKI